MVAHGATSGHYNAVYNSLALGMTEDGWEFEIVPKGEILTFEEFGDNAIDLVNRGVEIAVSGVLKEWTAEGMQAALWPYSSTFGKIDCTGEFAVNGSYAKPLILTAASCAPAGTDGPATITFLKAILDPDVAININLNNKVRMVPIRFRTFMTDTGSADNRYFTVT
jgi:hypothetical protein